MVAGANIVRVINMTIETKWITKDCEFCQEREGDICLWGVRDKKLMRFYPGGEEHKIKHCEYFGNPPVRSEFTKELSIKHIRSRNDDLKESKKASGQYVMQI